VASTTAGNRVTGSGDAETFLIAVGDAVKNMLPAAGKILGSEPESSLSWYATMN
jgi:hypothetical protein